jgi:hypothetical protein
MGRKNNNSKKGSHNKQKKKSNNNKASSSQSSQPQPQSFAQASSASLMRDSDINHTPFLTGDNHDNDNDNNNFHSTYDELIAAQRQHQRARFIPRTNGNNFVTLGAEVDMNAETARHRRNGTIRKMPYNSSDSDTSDSDDISALAARRDDDSNSSDDDDDDSSVPSLINKQNNDSSDSDSDNSDDESPPPMTMPDTAPSRITRSTTSTYKSKRNTSTLNSKQKANIQRNSSNDDDDNDDDDTDGSASSMPDLMDRRERDNSDSSDDSDSDNRRSVADGDRDSDSDSDSSADVQEDDGDPITIQTWTQLQQQQEMASREEERKRQSQTNILKERTMAGVERKRTRRIAAVTLIQAFMRMVLATNQRVRLQKQQQGGMICQIQKIGRAFLVRQTHGDMLKQHLALWRQFYAVWKGPLEYYQNNIASSAVCAASSSSSVDTTTRINMAKAVSWASLRDQQMFIRREDIMDDEDIDNDDEDEDVDSDDAHAIADRSSTLQALEGAAKGIMNQDNVDDDEEQEQEQERKDDFDNSIDTSMDQNDNHNNNVATHNNAEALPLIPEEEISSGLVLGSDTTIHLTHHAVKWLRQGAPKYRAFFVRRMRQLANGDRSRILAKRLHNNNKGSHTNNTSQATIIYETYLEQKSGFRILWTISNNHSEESDLDKNTSSTTISSSISTSSQSHLLVWYIAKHDQVSRLMGLINDSKHRGARQRTCVSQLPEFGGGGGGARTTTHPKDITNYRKDGTDTDNTILDHQKKTLVLDPLGNVPLKVYEIGKTSCDEDMEKILKETWMPKLYLTTQERNVVQTEGTVLLLGRSGTGKTICICNRMDWDRSRYDYYYLQSRNHNNRDISSCSSLSEDAHANNFSQLFVARSPRICKYVERTIAEPHKCSRFLTFANVLAWLTKQLSVASSPSTSTSASTSTQQRRFLPSNKVDYGRFKREFYVHEVAVAGTAGSSTLDPLLVWTHIRSFLKGSIEAIQADGAGAAVVSKEEYLSTNCFGKKRCRLSMAQRDTIYGIFERYQEYLKRVVSSSNNNTNKHHQIVLWDDCDRIVAILQQLQHVRHTDPDLFDHTIRQSKIYVDEIQDYTQAECLLFFLMASPGDLFLAGDSAQSVVEGVEFRFEDVRSVGYHVAGPDPKRRHLIPNKPLVVNVNFRSHAGILNCASGVLELLFDRFPHTSAKLLSRDEGIFRGPRPSVCHEVDMDVIRRLVWDKHKLNGVMVLTHDDKLASVQAALEEYPLVYGIREAKGLEFKSVIVLDFFSSLDKHLQKPWRELLLGRARHGSSGNASNTQDGGGDFGVAYPEVEGQLKLLYTAVTRCIETLFFCETTNSIAGDAFVRWITTTTTTPTPAKSGGDDDEGNRSANGMAMATRNHISDADQMSMTQDEWLARGLAHAESAEEEEVSSNNLVQAENLLKQATYCFEQAAGGTGTSAGAGGGSARSKTQTTTSFVDKAQAHLSSIQFQLHFAQQQQQEQDPQQNSSSKILLKLNIKLVLDVDQEMKAAGVVHKLLAQHLWLEANSFLTFLQPYVGSAFAQAKLETSLMHGLRGIRQE